MKKLYLMKTMLLLFALVVGSSSVWATDVEINFGTSDGYWAAESAENYTDSDDREWSRTFSAGGKSSGQAGYSQFGNSSNTCTSLVFTATAGSDMTVTAFSVKMAGASGSSSTTTGTIYLYKISGETETELASASVSGTSDVTCSITSSQTFSSTDVLKVSYVGTAKAIRVKQLTYSYTASGSGSTPSISASNVNITEKATSGSIEYTLNNATGTVTASTTSDWLSLGEVTSSAVPFTCSANTGAQRTATVTLSFTGATDKVVTITQAAKSVASPTYSLEGGSYMQGTSIAITSEGNTIYYNFTTDGSTPDNPTNASTEYTAPIVLGSGTTKIKAIAYDTYGNASSVVSRTYTGIALATLPFSWTGTTSAGKANLEAQNGVTLSLGSDYATSNAPYRLKFDGTSKYVIIYTDEKPESVYFTAKLFNEASTGSKIKVQGSADGITFTDVEEFTIKGSANKTFEFTTSNAFASTHRAVKLAMSSKDQNVAVGTISVAAAPVPVTITSAKYATYCFNKALDFSGVSGLTAYRAYQDGTAIKFEAVEKVPAGEGVLLKGEADTYNVPVCASASAIENEFVGVTTETTIPYASASDAIFVLKNGASGVGFYKTTKAFTVRANSAYLPSSVAAGRSFIGFEDETTGISEERRMETTAPAYNLQGQRVAQPAKGLYIVNGKKVVIK